MLKKYAGEICAFVVFLVLFWTLVSIAQFVKQSGVIDFFAHFIWFLSLGIFLAIPISAMFHDSGFSRFVIFKMCSFISLVVVVPLELWLAHITDIGLVVVLIFPCSGLVVSTIGQGVRLYVGRKQKKDAV